MRSYPNGPGGRSINLKFSGHLVFQKNLNRTLSIRTAFGCIRMGDSFRSNLTDINGNVIGKRNFIVHMDYLNIPLMLRIYPSINKNFFIQSGPYFGYLLRQEQRLGNFESIEAKFNYLSFTDRLDLGWTSSAGFIFTIKERFVLSIEFRNNLSLYHHFNETSYSGALKHISTNLVVGFNRLIMNKVKE